MWSLALEEQHKLKKELGKMTRNMFGFKNGKATRNYVCRLLERD
jgi:hypothetical protein